MSLSFYTVSIGIDSWLFRKLLLKPTKDRMIAGFLFGFKKF